MKVGIGVNNWVWTSPFTSASAPLIDRAAEMGFDVFEIAVEDPAELSGDAIPEALRRTGLRATVCGAFGPNRDLTHDDPAFREESLRFIEASLKLCSRWGARVFAGPMYSSVGKRRRVPADQKKREWGRAVSGLARAGAIAADQGVVLAIEPLNRFETDLVNTAEQALALVREIGHPNVRIHLDTFHMGIEEASMRQAILSAGPLLAHFHACESHRGTPGRGQVPWREVAEALREIGYGGDAVIESFTPECQAIAAAAAIWRPLAPSQDELAREGLKFLRQVLP